MKKLLIFFFLLFATAAQAQLFKVKSGADHPYKHKPTDLNSTNSPTNGQCSSYDSATGLFKWTGCASGGSSLTSLSDVGSATITAGNLLVADGTKFQSVSLSGDCTVTSSGSITCPGARLFSDAGTNTYLTSTTDNFAIGGTAQNSSFYVDATNNLINVGTGATNNGTAIFNASNGLAGRVSYDTDQSFLFTGAGSSYINIQNNGELRLSEAAENGPFYLSLKAPATFFANASYTLPSTPSTGFLTSDSSGVMSISPNSLVGLSDVGSATIAAGRLLISDGTKFQSKAVTGDVTLTSAGVISIGTGAVGPTQIASTSVSAGTYSAASVTVDADGRITNAFSSGLTGLSDVGSSTAGAGRLLINNGTKFQSVGMSGDCSITSAGAITCSGSNPWTRAAGDIYPTTITDRLLIGTSTPSWDVKGLNVENTILDDGSVDLKEAAISLDWTPSADNQKAAQGLKLNTIGRGATMDEVNNIDALAQWQGNDNKVLNRLTNIEAYTETNNVGEVQIGRGFYSLVFNSGDGVIDDARAFEAESCFNLGAGAITTCNGLYINDQNAGTNNRALAIHQLTAAGTNFSIYSDGTAKSYFAGNIGIGSTAAASPLTVVGDATITGGNSVGQCTLSGAATPTCTHTVPSGCVPVCTYNSASLPHIVACSVSGTTLTAVSATSLDSGTVNYHCF